LGHTGFDRNKEVALKRAMGAALLLMAAGVLIFAGCGDDETTTPCEFCEHWGLVLDGLARFPAYSPDPAHPDRIAFSSRFPDPDGIAEEDRYEHIWVLDGEDLYRITNDEFNDFDPAWSPDGDALAFTREMDGRLDIWTVDVTDLSAPGEPVVLTWAGNVEGGAFEPSWRVDNDGRWVVFASELDIYRIPDYGGTPQKLIPDPGDVGGGCGFDSYPDFQPCVAPDGRVAFTSIGRLQTGNLEIAGFYVEEDGDTVDVTDAEIYLDDCPTGFTTPHRFEFLPVRPDLGPYTVGLESPQHCDRRNVHPVVQPNMDVSIRYNFITTKGDLWVWVDEANCDVLDIVEGDTTEVAHLGIGFPWPDSTVVSCLAEGEHVIRVQWNVFTFVDTAITIVAGELDSLRFFRPSKSIWDRALMSPSDGVTASRVRPVQTGHEEVWVADLESQEMLSFWSLESQFEQACWSPDGRYVAFVASDPLRNRWGIRVAEVGGSSSWSIPLPGSGGSAACTRSAYQLSWNSSGDRLAATLGECGGYEDPQELKIWWINPGPFLGK
jgi:hypothetical protein